MTRLRRWTTRAREALPGPVVESGRTAVHRWGMLTARWRMAPDFLVVGAQRSGTTSLYRVLSEHPGVMRPTQAKGIGYFDLHYERGMRWYLAHFPLRVGARLRGRGRLPLTFESSGYYLFHPLAPDRIARDLPGVKVVVMVREPVERAYSAHRHELARGFETEPFERALELEERRVDDQEVRRLVADPRYRSHAHRHHAYLGRSRYAEQIQRYVDALGPDRVFILDADRFFEAPEPEFDRLQEFLGLPRWRPASFERWNARPRDPMPAELRRRLTEYFEPYDRQLADLMGRTPRWRQVG